MVNVRDVSTAEEVDREAERIKRFIASEHETVRIEWDTKEAMWEPVGIRTGFSPHHEFHDDQISDKDVVVVDFPYMQIFGDFRIFNGLTLREFDEFLARLVPIFCELKDMHEKKMGGVGKA